MLEGGYDSYGFDSHQICLLKRKIFLRMAHKMKDAIRQRIYNFAQNHKSSIHFFNLLYEATWNVF